MLTQMIIYFIIATASFILWNYLLIRTGKGVNHGVQVLVREIVWIAGALFFGAGDLVLVGIYFLACNLAFMFPFNTALNLLRGLAWSYIGETAWIDKQGRKWPAVYVLGSLLFMIMGLGFMVWPYGY